MNQQEPNILQLYQKFCEHSFSSSQLPSKELLNLKDYIHSLGLKNVWELCSLSIQNNGPTLSKFLLFNILGDLLHPRSDPTLLLFMINTLVPVAIKESERVVKLGLCKCISTIFYHILAPDTLDSIKTLLETFGPDLSIIFLNELVSVLKCALDVPMLAQKNFIILVNIMPPLLPTVIDHFFLKPEQDKTDILMFYLEKLYKPQLLALIAMMHTEQPFDVDAFVNSIVEIYNNKLPEITSVYARNDIDSDKKKHLINFFAGVVKYGLNIDIASNIITFIMNMPPDFRIAPVIIEMIRIIFANQPQMFNDNYLDYLAQISLFFAKNRVYEELAQSIGAVSYMYTKLYDCIPPSSPPNPKFSELAQHIIGLLMQYRPAPPETNNCEEDDEMMDDDEGDIERTNIEATLEHLVYISRDNPIPSLQIIEQCFGNIDIDNCALVISTLNKYVSIFAAFENESMVAESARLLKILLGSQAIMSLAEKSPAIAQEILHSFVELPKNDIGIQAFNFAREKYAHNDQIMKTAIEILRKYKFNFDQVPRDSQLSPKIMSLLVSFSPTPSVIEWINELMSSNDVNNFQSAAALLFGLQQARIQFDFSQPALFFAQKGLFPEAIKITWSEPMCCLQILDIAAQCHMDNETKDRTIANAIKAATVSCFSPLTERVLVYADLTENKNNKIFFLIMNLFAEHKNRMISGQPNSELTDNSILIMKNLTQNLIDNFIISYNLIFGLLDSLIFVFERIYPILDDTFWITVITYYMTTDPKYSRDSPDLLFQFAKADFQRYRIIMLKVLMQVTDETAAITLIDYLHDGITKDDPSLRNAYTERLYCVYKAFSYYKQFV